MYTKYDKAFVGLLVPVILYAINWGVQRMGGVLTPEVQAALETIIWALTPVLIGAAVYRVPNKGYKLVE